VGVLAHIFKGLPLFLHGIVGSTSAEDLDLCGLDFHCLTAAHALYELSLDADAGTCGDELQQFFVEASRVCNDLDVLYRATVVEGDEIDILGTTMGTDPAFGTNLATRLGGKEIYYLCSFHIIGVKVSWTFENLQIFWNLQMF